MSTDEIIAALREIGVEVLFKKEYIFLGIGGIYGSGQTLLEAIKAWVAMYEAKYGVRP